MSGLSIGVGVGLKYSTPINVKGGSVSPPEEDVTDAFLLEGTTGVLLMEDGSYFKIETTEVQTLKASSSTTTTKKKSSRTSKIEKSYWNL